MNENVSPNSEEILKMLDILLSDLTDEQKSKLEKLAETIKDPSRLTVPHIMKIVKDLKINLDDIQKKAKKAKGIQPKINTAKIRVNSMCNCGSGKKYKKCCMNKI
jgi:uncharacterized protein YecA (UPF0149 family)